MAYCEYGSIINNSIFCNPSNDNCVFVRWCYTNQCIKNTEGYINCKVRSEEMTKKNTNKSEDKIFTLNDDIEIDSTDNKIINKQEFIEEYCSVIWKKPHSFAINFIYKDEEFGVSFHVKDNHFLEIEKVKDMIKVKYCGEYGTPDFEIYPIYE